MYHQLFKNQVQSFDDEITLERLSNSSCFEDPIPFFAKLMSSFKGNVIHHYVYQVHLNNAPQHGW